MRVPAIDLQIEDLTSRFLDFYHQAVAEAADSERRWHLWEERYGFAAVPPTAQGCEMARELLERAWPEYPSVLGRIQAGADGLEPEPRAVLRRVADALGCELPLTVRLIVFVGALEGNAYSYGRDGVPVVCIPVEQEPRRRALVLPHEFTHAVHLKTAGLSGGWERSVARIVLEEGLATRVTELLEPGLDANAYVGYEGAGETPDWFHVCTEREPDILRGILPELRDGSSDAVTRFTFGSGTTGLEREAYYVGWVIVGDLLARGRTLAELAVVPEASIPALVEAAISQYLTAER